MNNSIETVNADALRLEAVHALKGNHELFDLIVTRSREMLTKFGVLATDPDATNVTDATLERIETVVTALSGSRNIVLDRRSILLVSSAVHAQSQVDQIAAI